MGSPQASARIMPESLEGVKAQQQGASLTEPRSTGTLLPPDLAGALSTLGC
jgi:hypothetical protein